MRKIALVFVSTLCLATLACHGAIKKEVKAYIDEKDDLILQIGKAIEANPTDAGVVEARKIFETKKANLKTKRLEIFKKDIPFDLVQLMLNSNVSDGNMFDAIGSKLQDVNANENFTKLRNEFNADFHQ